MNAEEIKQIVTDRYAQTASAVREHDGTVPAAPSDVVSGGLYSDEQASELPLEALHASLGCGNPSLIAKLEPGEVVLDLGSGGGIDVLLSARRVGPAGKAYGLDMTDEMLALAQENRARSGLSNVEFLKGEIEDVPLPDASVDVIISNCVINLSADKDKVLHEAFRVLAPGGRFAVSDIVTRWPIPAALRDHPAIQANLWSQCIAGALDQDDYERKLDAAGFAEIAITPTRVFALDTVQAFLAENGITDPAVAHAVDGLFMSATITATKPRGAVR